MQVRRSVIGRQSEVVAASQVNGTVPAIKRKVQRVADTLRRAGVRRDVSSHVTGNTHRRMRTGDVVVEQTSFCIPAANTAKCRVTGCKCKCLKKFCCHCIKFSLLVHVYDRLKYMILLPLIIIIIIALQRGNAVSFLSTFTATD